MKKSNRLLKNSEFIKIIRGGNKIFGTNISLYFIKTKDTHKIGISISKKVSKLAVIRNKNKRRIVAAINELGLENNLFYNIVIMAKPSIVDLDYEQIKNELKGLFEKIKK